MLYFFLKQYIVFWKKKLFLLCKTYLRERERKTYTHRDRKIETEMAGKRHREINFSAYYLVIFYCLIHYLYRYFKITSRIIIK